MKCFFHSADLDGHSSGAIVNQANNYNVELFGINYGDLFPWEKITDPNEKVYMVDFALQPFSDMQKLNKMCKLIWIDHHTSAIEEAHKQQFIASGGQILEVGKGACELVWNYFYQDIENEVVRLLGRYDVWDLQPNTLELQQGIRLFDTWPTNNTLWKTLLGLDYKNKLDQIIENGKLILQKQNQDNKAYAKSCSFETELDGLKCIAINKGLTNSQLFKSVYNPKYHDAMLTFVWRKSQWTISLYTDHSNIDVSIICKSRGGGGHKQAAGFQCDKLPFELN